MVIRHFINSADSLAGGAQKVAHQLLAVADKSSLMGFDYLYKDKEKTKTNMPLCFLTFIFCCLFRRKDTLVLHHRIFLAINAFLRHPNTYFICHNIFPNKNFIFNVDAKVTYIAVSDDVRDYLSNYKGVKKLTTIYNGLDIDRRNVKVCNGNDVFTVFYVGRLAKQKGVEELIRGFLIFELDHPSAVLSIIGDGEDREILLSLASGCRNINFLGRMDNPFHQCKNADLIVIPSLYEGFGLVYYEALEYGHLVAASDLDVFEKVPEDEGVIFFEAGDFDAVAHALVRAHQIYSTYKYDATKKRHRFPMVEDMISQYKKLLVGRL
ncbi:MAG: glycosyltransferase family 4 protein [Colwellia sp.]|jgi:Glycosyltransferase